MATKKLKDTIHWVGAVDWDRTLFDELIPLPDGTTYNSYLVIGSTRTALIDTVDPSKRMELVNHLDELGITRLDYIICNHAEQDHSGAIPSMLQKYPKATVVTNKKCADLLIQLLSIPEHKFVIIKDGEEISLGNKTLRFLFTPWVHWPETMVTYLVEDQVLFSCDFFGSHLACSELYAEDSAQVLESAKRYYAEIMMPFRAVIRRNLAKLSGLPIQLLAPSHGPVYKNPDTILRAYQDWTSDSVKNEVVVPFVSMHGSTRVMVNYLIDAFVKRGIRVKPFNLTTADVGELAMAMVDAATIVIGTPMVLGGPHPSAVYAAYLVKILRPKTRFISIVGSYGWGGKLIDDIKAILGNINAEFVEPVLCKGYPRTSDLQAVDRLADEIAVKQRQLD